VLRSTFVAVLWLCSSAFAQQARFTGSWLDEGTDLRSAFRDVIADARQCVIQVLVDDQKVVLGTVVAADGWIVTKGSEIHEPVRCRLPDGRELSAVNAGYDRETDLMLLKVSATDLPVVRWSTATDPAVGQWLATVSQDPRPVAVGIISVPRRHSVEERISGVLGIVLESGNGTARIADIIADSAAAAADLQAGDVILRIADRVVEGSEAVKRMIKEYDPGTTLQIAIRRGNTELELTATLTHPFGRFLTRIAEQNQMGGELSGRRTGFPAVLQHDTVLSPGQCGGPVVDLDGDAVGINIARAGRTESYALPADVVTATLEKLRSAAGTGEQLANETAPPAPEDADATPVSAPDR
jgi:serine protease Do